MVFGVDIEALQNSHRMRGIGSVVRNFINHLPTEARQHKFIFFAHPYNDIDPLADLNLEGLDYQVRFYGSGKTINRSLPGRLNLFISAANRIHKLYDMRYGDSRLSPNDIGDIDCFLQIDPSAPLPRYRFGMKRAVFVHDLIPYILEWDYLWNYATARRHGFSRKAALRVQCRRSLFRLEYKLTVKAADLLIANSECTKQDFIRYLGVSPQKISVVHLGIDNQIDKSSRLNVPDQYYRSTSWGYLPFKFDFPTDTPFLLFVGGADQRRKLSDVVVSFNQLRGRGVDIKLVLAGDCMKGPMDIATIETQSALKDSSYINDIIFLGYINETSLRWLYAHAIAYVFPSMYEGFGLPVLEAMNLSCPVISYRSAAIVEIAGEALLYASNVEEIMSAVHYLLTHSRYRDKLIIQGREQVKKFSWYQTSTNIMNIITNS